MRRNQHFVCVLVFGLISSVRASFASAETPATLPTVSLTIHSFPSTPGYHVIKGTAVADDKTLPIACGLFLPPAYFKPHAPLPIVMTLHNRGMSGSDGGDSVVGEGLGLLMFQGGPDSRATGTMPPHPIDLREDGAFIGLAPQCPRDGWENPQVVGILVQLINQVAKACHADEDRVYLTGFSYGGSSTWRVAMLAPGRFAAIVPLEGRATPHPQEDIREIRNLAIYVAVGGDDGEFIRESERMRDALTTAGHAGLIYRVIPKGNHWCYASVYQDPDFWKWLLAQHRHPATRP